MKHKTQTTCHSELVEGSHHTNYFVTSSLSRSHSLIKKLTHRLSLSCFLILISCISFAQEYDWQWAKSGGGELGFSGGVTQSFRDECVIDIVTDTENNHYYLMNINGNSPMYHDDILPEDIALEHYGGKDILLLSTDEEGNYRWHQVIGGQLRDSSYSIVVDNDNGVYVNALLVTTAIEGDSNSYTHLSSEVTLPKVPENWDYTVPHPAFRLGYLLKYSQTDGSLLTYKNYQEETLFQSFTLSRLWIDSNDIIHTYVGLAAGTHLDGLITVDEGNFDTYLVQFDTSLNIIGTPQLLPLIGTNHDKNFFAYDEVLNRYYIGGSNEGTQQFSYDGLEIEEQSFILAIDGETLAEEWRSGFNITSVSSSSNLSDIFIDEESNLYLSGRYTYNSSTGQRSFGSHQLPDDIEGAPIYFAHVPYAIKLNTEGDVEWVKVPDSFTNEFSHGKQNENESIVVANGEVVTVPRNPASVWGDYEIVSEQDYNTLPAVVRLNPETGGVIGATFLEGYGAFTKVVADQNGDLVLGGSFFGEMFSDHDELPTLQAVSSRTDFFLTKLHIDTGSGTDDYLQANIKVYPNPTTDIVYFETEEPLQSYELYNMLGQQITQAMFNSHHIDLSSYPTGTYFIKVITQNGDTGMFKVVKE